MLRHCVVIITRYCAMIALALVVGFATGVFIEVVKLKATGADVSFIWRPVTPHYQVADRAKMTARAVAQITQPSTPPPEITQPSTPPPKITQPPTPDRASINSDAFRALVRCLDSSANSPYLQRWWERLDEGSRAHAKMIPSCGSEVDAFFAVPSEKVAKILREGVYGIAIQFLEMNRDEQIRPIPWGRDGNPYCLRLQAAGLTCLSSPDEIEQLPQYPQYIDGPLPPTCSARPYCR
jgi:hypothetical protein